jgi:hypothetical protein
MVASGASPEDAVHAAVADVLRLSLSPGWMWWHTPNEGRRSRYQQGRMKRMGMMSGVPDIILIRPDGIVHALEIKRPRSETGRALGRLSDAQSAFFAALPPACPRACAHGVGEALDVLSEWGAIRGTVTAGGDIRPGRPVTDTPAPATIRTRRAAERRAAGEQPDDEISRRARAAWARRREQGDL